MEIGKVKLRMDDNKPEHYLAKPIPVTACHWENDALPLVSISCITYNHENFIRAALEGFLMQETTFPVEILIHDDASTDETAAIIREYQQKYPDLIFPIYQTENQHSKGIKISATYQFPRARGKYIALCEGDDYWIDPLKLQKQVDFLEANHEYGICGTRYFDLKDGHKSEREIFSTLFNSDEIFTFTKDNLFSPYVVMTLTVVFKKELLCEKALLQPYFKDIFLYASILQKQKGAILNFISAVHRHHLGGINSMQSNLVRTRNNYLTAKSMYRFFRGDDNLHIKDFYINASKSFYYELKNNIGEISFEEKKILTHIFFRYITVELLKSNIKHWLKKVRLTHMNFF